MFLMNEGMLMFTRTLNVLADFALDLGMGLSVMSPPEITSLEAVRGGEVAVDAANSGYAYVLYSILDKAGSYLYQWKAICFYRPL